MKLTAFFTYCDMDRYGIPMPDLKALIELEQRFVERAAEMREPARVAHHPSKRSACVTHRRLPIRREVDAVLERSRYRRARRL